MNRKRTTRLTEKERQARKRAYNQVYNLVRRADWSTRWRLLDRLFHSVNPRPAA